MIFKSKFILPDSTNRAPAKSQVFCKLKVKGSAISGKGVYAAQLIPKGTTISVDGGDLLSSVSDLPADKVYAVIFSKNIALVPHDFNRPDALCFMNHSCDANVARLGSLVFVAKKNIKIGQELTADYATLVTDVAAWNLECRCKAKKCRKIISSIDYKNAKLQKALWSEWPPYVQQKILKKR